MSAGEESLRAAHSRLAGGRALRCVPAADAAAAALAARYGEAPDRDPADADTLGDLRLAPHQVDGAARLRAILRRFGIALLADDVGMGKTRTALAAAAALTDSRRILLVAPAPVVTHWRANLHAAFTRAAAMPMIVTHGQLSRGWQRPAAISSTSPRGPPVVIVDEAHAFRNPATARHRWLVRTCRWATVLLITATPVVNSLMDLYFQLRLGVGDAAFRRLGVDDLRLLFRLATARPRSPPEAFRALMASVVVARSRRFLAAEDRARLGFPRRAPPVVVRCRLPLAENGATLIRSVDRLRLPWFGSEVAAGSRRLVRLMLLKRLESGTAAFATSLRRLESYNERASGALRSGVLLQPAAARTGAADQLELDTLLGAPAPLRTDRRRILEDAAADATTFAELRSLLASAGRDAKLDALIRLLEAARGDPTIIFTAYRDTAVMLWCALRERYRCALLHGRGGAIGASPATRAEVVPRFAPLSNGLPPPRDAERIDVLVATDALSEGLNLQDARRVISYDLPWHPVRLRQRVGRVDRLGCPHAEVQSCELHPDPILERRLDLLRRLARKRAAAAAVSAERIARARLADWLAAEERLREMRRRLPRAVSAPVAPLHATTTLPRATRAFAITGEAVDQRFWWVPAGAPVAWRPCPGEVAADILEGMLADARPPVVAASDADTLVAALESRGRSPGRPGNMIERIRLEPVEARTAKRIRWLLSRAGIATDPGLLRRADAALAACRRGFDPDLEHAVRRALGASVALDALLRAVVEGGAASAKDDASSETATARELDNPASTWAAPPANTRLERFVMVVVTDPDRRTPATEVPSSSAPNAVDCPPRRR